MMSSSNGHGESSCAWADLPSCGLGNKLLIWGKALAFAQSRALPLVVTGWNNHAGWRTWLKGGGWRRYQQDFVTLNWRELRHWKTRLHQSDVIDEPKLEDSLNSNCVARFYRMTHWSDYFADVKPIRELVRAELPKLLTAVRREAIASVPKIDMAVHIRMGDFRPLKPGEKFAEVGQVRTPLDYFVEVIQNVRVLVGNSVHVTVFSDGKVADLAQVLQLPNVQMAEPNAAIVDIYRMSNSKLLVCAAGSTFSYWSVFLGDQPAILHRDHIHQSIRPTDIGRTLFEGGVSSNLSDWPELLRENLQQIEW